MLRAKPEVNDGSRPQRKSRRALAAASADRQLHVEIRSVTKDSLGVAWSRSLPDNTPSTVSPAAAIAGYKIRYQAVGSTVVQYSHMLQPTVAAYDITQLHENTYYEVCVKVFTVPRHRVDERNQRQRQQVQQQRDYDEDDDDRQSATDSLEWNDYETATSDELPLVVGGLTHPAANRTGVTPPPPVVHHRLPSASGFDFDSASPSVSSTLPSSGFGYTSVSGSTSHFFHAASASGLDADSVSSSPSASGSGPTMTACVTESTGINSLSVALGSTFGAFLALGVIIAFVLAAKWQHVRRKRKSLLQLQLLHRFDESFDSLDAANGDARCSTPTTMRNGMMIEMTRFGSATSTSDKRRSIGVDAMTGDEVEADEDDEDNDENYDETAGTTDGGTAGIAPCDDSPSSDFSADIILHGPAGFTSDGLPVSGSGADDDESAVAATAAARQLLLDSATCAGSFIMANEQPTGRTYSLLVPLSAASGVQQFLQQQQQRGLENGQQNAAGGVQFMKIAGNGGGATTGVGTAGQSIVRLKLRKHATVDYSSVDVDDDWMHDQRYYGNQPSYVGPTSSSRSAPRPITSSGNVPTSSVDAYPSSSFAQQHQNGDGSSFPDSQPSQHPHHHQHHRHHQHQQQQQQYVLVADPEVGRNCVDVDAAAAETTTTCEVIVEPRVSAAAAHHPHPVVAAVTSNERKLMRSLSNVW